MALKDTYDGLVKTGGNMIGFKRRKGGPSGAQSAIPAAAIAAGYSRMVFNDDFASINTIDMSNTYQPGYNWYLDNPGTGWVDMDPSGVSVANSVLTLNMKSESSMGIFTCTNMGHVGSEWKFGYFEASIAFDPALSKTSNGWPSFWAISAQHAKYASGGAGAELDFFEAWHSPGVQYSGWYYGTLHDWRFTPERSSNPNNYYALNSITDFNQFHRYGCLWQPGRCTWFFDGIQVLTQAYSVGGVPVPNPAGHAVGTFSNTDTDPICMVLGTGVDFPMRVDWVRVWQA